MAASQSTREKHTILSSKKISPFPLQNFLVAESLLSIAIGSVSGSKSRRILWVQIVANPMFSLMRPQGHGLDSKTASQADYS